MGHTNCNLRGTDDTPVRHPSTIKEGGDWRPFCDADSDHGLHLRVVEYHSCGLVYTDPPLSCDRDATLGGPVVPIRMGDPFGVHPQRL